MKYPPWIWHQRQKYNNIAKVLLYKFSTRDNTIQNTVLLHTYLQTMINNSKQSKQKKYLNVKQFSRGDWWTGMSLSLPQTSCELSFLKKFVSLQLISLEITYLCWTVDISQHLLHPQISLRVGHKSSSETLALKPHKDQIFARIRHTKRKTVALTTIKCSEAAKEFKRADCQGTAQIATINAKTVKKLKWVTFRKQFFIYTEEQTFSSAVDFVNSQRKQWR